jgi:hypothetical protein
MALLGVHKSQVEGDFDMSRGHVPVRRSDGRPDQSYGMGMGVC